MLDNQIEKYRNPKETPFNYNKYFDNNGLIL